MRKTIRTLAQLLPLALAAACASTSLDPFNGGGGNGDGGTGGGGNADAGNGRPGCVGRQCQVNYSCPVGSPTTITGVVTIPAGNLPLYNANVYIPSGEVPPAPTSGPSCDRCEQIVPLDVAAKTTTDVNGSFTLTNVPSGKDIPLVIRVGKWRRVITIPSVTDCTSTAIDVTQTRLPRNRNEGNTHEQVMFNILKKDINEHIAQVPAPYKDMIAWCLRKHAEDRVQTAHQLLQLLEGKTAISPAKTRSTATPIIEMPLSQAQKITIFVICTLASPLVGLVYYLFTKNRQPQNAKQVLQLLPFAGIAWLLLWLLLSWLFM